MTLEAELRVEPFFIRPPRETDLVYLAERLRPADLAEVRGMIGGSSVLEALRASVALSPICGTALPRRAGVSSSAAAGRRPGRGSALAVGHRAGGALPGAHDGDNEALHCGLHGALAGALELRGRRNLASVRWLQRLGFKSTSRWSMGVAGEPSTRSLWGLGHVHPGSRCSRRRCRQGVASAGLSAYGAAQGGKTARRRRSTTRHAGAAG
jgi:hypothetical protein